MDKKINPDLKPLYAGRTDYFAVETTSEKTVCGVSNNTLGRQTILCAQSDLFSHRIKFVPQEREALISLSSKELCLILNLSKNNEKEKNIFDYIIENNFLPLKKDDFQNKSAEEIIQIIEKYVPVNSEYADDINKKLQIITSGEFKNELSQIHNNFQGEDLMIHYGLLKIFIAVKNKFDRNKYLTTLKTKEFKDFYKKIGSVCGIDGFYEIIEIMDVYFCPRLLKSLRSPETEQKIAVLKEKLHEDCRYLLPYVAAAIEDISLEEIRERACLYGKILSMYPYTIKDFAELNTLLCVEIDALKTLSDPAVKQNFWNYINDHHQFMLLRYGQLVFCEFLTDFAKFVLYLKNLKTTAKDFDEFLQIFSIKFSDVQKLSDFTEIEISPDQIKQLSAGKQNFQKYLQKLRADYPCIKIDLQHINKIIFSYNDGKNFSELNRLSEQINKGKKLDLPVFADKDSGIKIKILGALTHKNFEKIIVKPGREVFDSADIKNLDNVLEKINTGAAKNLYAALIENWRLQYVELDKFLIILSNNNAMNLFLNKENAAVFFELKDKYNILFRNDGKEGGVESLDDLYLRHLFKLLDMSQILKQDAVKIYLFKNFEDFFKNRGKERGIYLKDLMLLLNLLPSLAECPQTSKLEETIRSLYLFNNEEVSRLYGLLNAQYDAPGLFEVVKAPETLKIFNHLSGAYFFPKPHALLFAAKISPRPGALKILEVLKDDLQINLINKPGAPVESKCNTKNTVTISNGAEINSDIAYVLKFLLPYNDIVDNLFDPSFIVFYKKVIGRFYNNTQKKEIIPHLSRLYDEVKNKPDLEELLFSKKFQETLLWVGSEFHVTKPHPSILLPVLKIAKNISKVKSFIEKLNEPVCANDLYLLACAAERPEYEKLLFDRNNMIRELKDAVKIVPSKTKQRMALEECSNLHLLRLILFKRALENKNFLKSMAKNALLDSKDNGTECGGNLTIDANGEALMDARPSLIFLNNSAYQNDDYLPFINGFSLFHYHPFKSNRNYLAAEPSGENGDIGVAKHNDLSGALFTEMSDPCQNNGKISINACFYFIDKSYPEKQREAVFDFGVFTAEI